MKLSDKQNALFQYCKEHGFITRQTAVDMLGKYYYHNGAHYVSEILTRMVNQGIFIREKRGKYKLGGRVLKKEFNINQTELF